MPSDRRRALVDAGIDLLLGQRFHDWLSSIDTRAITDAVGVTTGSFFHHFRNRADFTDAVTGRFRELWAERVAHLIAQSQRVADEVSPEVQRAAAQAEWEALARPSPTVALQHLLWVARDRSVGDDTSTAAGDVLRQAYAEMTEAVLPVYRAANDAVGREMMPPFTDLDLAVLMNALAEGLQMRGAVDPGSVRPDLYADGVSALYLAISRPTPERGDPAVAVDLTSLNADHLVARRPAPVVSDDTAETWRAIAEAAAPLFVDRSPSEVRIAEVAAMAGVSTSTVYNHFGTVSAVAAAGFGRHLRGLAEIADRPLTAGEGPLVRIEQVLTRYVELLQAHRGAAEALVAQVARETGPADRGPVRHLRDMVPLHSLLVGHVAELRARGALRRRIETERLARMLIQLVTVHALGNADDPVERIVDDVLTIVFDGALVVADR